MNGGTGTVLSTHRPAVFLQSAVAAGLATGEVRPAAGAVAPRDTGTHRPTFTNPLGGFFLRIISPTFEQSRWRGSSRAHIDQPTKIPLGGFPTGTHRPTLRNPLRSIEHHSLHQEQHELHIVVSHCGSLTLHILRGQHFSPRGFPSSPFADQFLAHDSPQCVCVIPHFSQTARAVQ